MQYGVERILTLKKDKFLSELPAEEVQAAELEITDLPCDKPSTEANSFIKEVSIQTPTVSSHLGPSCVR